MSSTENITCKPNPVLEDDTDDRWKWFKGCLGALDGTYISIRVEAIYKPRYRTRKRDIATNVLGVCDRNLNFIYVLLGWEGSTVDGRVITICAMEDIQMEMGDNTSPRCREELFNMKHARVCNIKIFSYTKRRSNMSQKMARVWIQEEEFTLVDGLKKLCANDWKEDNGTFKHGYLMKLEQHMNVCHPNCGLQALPHIFSKIRGWKKHFMTISLAKSRSGLGFRYIDGTILVDDPEAWDDFIKVDLYAKSMTFKKWPLFADWEEIFRKDGATEQSAERT
ncbi:hypothetical protein KY290_010072 [Solanum tuberosum]|uniref:Uncharacterized protein n=2 Tax=Solanum tuberosum TaxID=4113 RepID=A0ABQ7VYX8_SOLTU|nr:hypothetical protein KY289_010454 [Solanum tuberosum]KAH0772935.1 hypothetical protein KY290_010072 [Solanum tuberosum]